MSGPENLGFRPDDEFENGPQRDFSLTERQIFVVVMSLRRQTDQILTAMAEVRSQASPDTQGTNDYDVLSEHLRETEALIDILSAER